MNLNFPLLRPVRILLFPFSVIYALVVWIRNILYERHILSSIRFNLPVICIGNLVAGGTGKSPLVEMLIKSIKGHYVVAVLSRGYKRKTRGYTLANPSSSVLEIGDEPMQFHIKFPDIPVAVGEERIVAIPLLLHDIPSIQAIILDDAFQHRAISAGLNILLTDLNNLFTRDWYLPTGDLRDEKRSYKRTEIIVVTKCPADFDLAAKEKVVGEIRPLPGQQIFFSTINYGIPYHLINGDKKMVSEQTEVLLVTGIANPRSLKKFVMDSYKTYYQISFNDHHIYSIDDLREIVRRFQGISASDKIILTTEKDAVRLSKFHQEIAEMPFYVMPIECDFLFGEKDRFIELITNFIKSFNSAEYSC